MSDILSNLLGGKRKSPKKSIYPKRPADQKRFVWEGKLPHTKSGLTKSDLVQSKSGQIVSKKRHNIGVKRMASMRRKGEAAPPFKRKSRR